MGSKSSQIKKKVLFLIYIYDSTMLELFFALFGIFLGISFLGVEQGTVYNALFPKWIWTIGFLLTGWGKIHGWLFNSYRIRYYAVQLHTFMVTYLAILVITSQFILGMFFVMIALFQMFIWYRHKQLIK